MKRSGFPVEMGNRHQVAKQAQCDMYSFSSLDPQLNPYIFQKDNLSCVMFFFVSDDMRENVVFNSTDLEAFVAMQMQYDAI